MAEPSRRWATKTRAIGLGRRALVVVLVVAYGSGSGCGWGGGGSDRADPADDALDPERAPSLTSCTGPPPGQQVAITFVHAESGPRAARIAAYVDDFEAAHPGIDVEVSPDPDGTDAVIDAWRSREPEERPELVLLPQTASGLLVDSGQTVAPGACLTGTVPDLLPAIAGAWSAGGVAQAVPFAVSTPVLLYNRRVFRAAGLDPDRPPRTLDDLERKAIKIVQAEAAETGLVIDTGPESGASWMIEQLNARVGQASLAPRNGRHGPATSVTWRSGPALDHLTWLADGLDEGWAKSVGRSPRGQANLFDAVEPGSLDAMTFHTSGALGDVYTLLDSGNYPQVELGVAPLPTPAPRADPRSGSGSLPGGSALWLAGGQPGAETAAAWALASYLASPAVQADWAVATGYTPISRTAARQPLVRTAWQRHPGLGVAYGVLAEQGTSAAELGPLAGPLDEIHELEARALDRIVDGADPAEALTAAADDADRLLQAYASSRPDS